MVDSFTRGVKPWDQKKKKDPSTGRDTKDKTHDVDERAHAVHQNKFVERADFS